MRATTVSQANFLRCTEHAEEVLDYLDEHPEGVTSAQIGEQFPELSVQDRKALVYRLHIHGLIEDAGWRKDRKIWRAVQ